MTIANQTAAAIGNIQSFNIAVIGGGICGACIASGLSSSFNNDQRLKQKYHLNVDIFDQGRNGVGGRTSHRMIHEQDNIMRWDHGCQFFRADTPRMASIVKGWMASGLCAEWKGKFTTVDSGLIGDDKNSVSCNNVGNDSKTSFFGMPNKPPFYVGIGGMKSIAKGLIDHAVEASISDNSNCKVRLFEGTRIAGLHRNDGTKTWSLTGIGGEAAYHDTPESLAKSSIPRSILNGKEYDAVMLTDISSSTFKSWHRASAAVPESFVAKVKDKVGSRVPLFSCLIAFDEPLPIEESAISFLNNPDIWFAAKSNNKPGIEGLKKECWTIISTPQYAVRKIEETPMQDRKTGEFIPQSKEYLTSVPGPELSQSFLKTLSRSRSTSGITLNEYELPNIVYLSAQRWGSAMPSHRHLNENSITRKVLSGVEYDFGQASLAPTKVEKIDQNSFIVDKDLMLFQAGDMVSNLTPGFEGAALSGFDATDFLT